MPPIKRNLKELWKKLIQEIVNLKLENSVRNKSAILDKNLESKVKSQLHGIMARYIYAH